MRCAGFVVVWAIKRTMRFRGGGGEWVEMFGSESRLYLGQRPTKPQTINLSDGGGDAGECFTELNIHFIRCAMLCIFVLRIWAWSNWRVQCHVRGINNDKPCCCSNQQSPHKIGWALCYARWNSEYLATVCFTPKTKCVHDFDSVKTQAFSRKSRAPFHKFTAHFRRITLHSDSRAISLSLAFYVHWWCCGDVAVICCRLSVQKS